MNLSWLMTGLLTAPQAARLDIHYATEPSGYRAHWTFDEVRVGALPAFPVRGPKDEEQLLSLSFQTTEEGHVQFIVQITEDREVEGQVESVSVFSPRLTAAWEQEAKVVSTQRERMRWVGTNRWLDVRVELRVTAWPIEPVPAGPAPVAPASDASPSQGEPSTHP